MLHDFHGHNTLPAQSEAMYGSRMNRLTFVVLRRKINKSAALYLDFSKRQGVLFARASEKDSRDQSSGM